MADLRTRFIEDYAGGLLNVARQELSSTGEVLAQDGFVDNLTLFVEDGRGVKSGLRLGSSLVECIDPVTEAGVLNVRTADRTYAKMRELKLFATAVASAQAALSDSVASSLQNLEGAFESLENDLDRYDTQLGQVTDRIDSQLENISADLSLLNTTTVPGINTGIQSVSDRVSTIESTLESVQVVTTELTISGSTILLNNLEPGTFTLEINHNFYGVTEVTTNVPAWVTLYTDAVSRGSEQRTEGDPATVNSGVVLDVVTGVGNLSRKFMPLVVGSGTDNKLYIRAVNKAGSPVEVRVTVKYIPI